jgi:hypothetical protein
MDRIQPEAREERLPSFSTALKHVAEATQRAVVSHMDLIRLEAHEDLTNVMCATTLIIIGGVFLVGLVALLEALLVQAHRQRFSLMASIGIAAVIHAAVGGGILGTGMRWMHRIKFMQPDEGPGYGGSVLFPKPRAGADRDDEDR